MKSYSVFILEPPVWCGKVHQCLFPFQGNFVARIALVCVNGFHVSLSGGDIFVRHVALDGADVRTGCGLKRGVGSAVGVEGDILVDSGRANPTLHGCLRPATLQSLEH